VWTEAEAIQRPFRFSAKCTDARATRRRRESTTTSVTWRRAPRLAYAIRLTRTAIDEIFTVARAVSFPALAVTVAFPGRRGLNVVEDPVTGDTVPFEADHVAEGATVFPYASTPDAEKRCVPSARSVTFAGVTASFTGAPGRTVTTCSAPARPGALALIVAAPAVVSR